MASEWALKQRAIRPRFTIRFGGVTPNTARKMAKAGAKAERIPVRRWKRKNG